MKRLRSTRCFGPRSEQHRRGCRPGRPACRWRRRVMGICHCSRAHYPHRAGWCKGNDTPAAILKSASWRAA